MYSRNNAEAISSSEAEPIFLFPNDSSSYVFSISIIYPQSILPQSIIARNLYTHGSGTIKFETVY